MMFTELDNRHGRLVQHKVIKINSTVMHSDVSQVFSMIFPWIAIISQKNHRSDHALYLITFRRICSSTMKSLTFQTKLLKLGLFRMSSLLLIIIRYCGPCHGLSGVLGRNLCIYWKDNFQIYCTMEQFTSNSPTIIKTNGQFNVNMFKIASSHIPNICKSGP